MAAEWSVFVALYVAAVLLLLFGSSAWRWLRRGRVAAALHQAVESRRAVRRAGAGELPEQRRPFEVIAYDLARLRARLDHPARGTSRTKFEALQHAYDRRMAEAASALGIEHLLEVLAPGPDLDGERTRVEAQLWLAGMRFDDAA